MYTTIIRVRRGFTRQLVEDGIKDSSIAGVFISLRVIFCGCILNWFILSPLKDPFLVFDIKISPLIFIFSSIILICLWGCSNFLFKKGLFFLLLNFSYYIWFLVPGSSQIIIKLPLILSKKSLIIDQGWLEVLGPRGVYNTYNIPYNWNSSSNKWSG